MKSFADSFKKFANTIYDKREEDRKVIAQCYEQLRSMVGTVISTTSSMKMRSLLLLIIS